MTEKWALIDTHVQLNKIVHRNLLFSEISCMQFQNYHANKAQLSSILFKPCLAVVLSNSHWKNLQKKIEKKKKREKKEMEKFDRQITVQILRLDRTGGDYRCKLFFLSNRTLTIYIESNPVNLELCTVFQSNEAASLMEIMSSQYLASSLTKLFLFNFQSQKNR